MAADAEAKAPDPKRTDKPTDDQDEEVLNVKFSPEEEAVRHDLCLQEHHNCQKGTVLTVPGTFDTSE